MVKNISIPDDVHKAAKLIATEKEIKLSEYVTQAIKEKNENST